MEPEPEPLAAQPRSDTTRRHLLTAIQWSAVAVTAAGLVWFAANVGGPGLLTAFSGFVVYLLAWWVKLQGWRYRSQ